MDLVNKLPDLADDALANLGDNAERLVKSGTPKQRQAAEALIPAIQAEKAVRSTRKAEARATALAARRKKTARG